MDSINLRLTRQDSSLSFSDYVAFLEQQKYQARYDEVKETYNAKIEDDKNYGVPAMNRVFYSKFHDSGKPLSWQDFITEYKRQNCQGSGSMMTFTVPYPRYQYMFSEDELDKKLMRTVMSFYKEGYVLHWLWENGLPEAYYDLSMDKKGADVCVDRPNGMLYALKIYANTNAAREFADIKEKLRIKLPSNSVIMALEAPIGDKEIKIGDTCVYPDELLKGTRNLIKLGATQGFKA